MEYEIIIEEEVFEHALIQMGDKAGKCIQQDKSFTYRKAFPSHDLENKGSSNADK